MRPCAFRKIIERPKPKNLPRIWNEWSSQWTSPARQVCNTPTNLKWQGEPICANCIRTVIKNLQWFLEVEQRVGSNDINKYRCWILELQRRL